MGNDKIIFDLIDDSTFDVYPQYRKFCKNYYDVILLSKIYNYFIPNRKNKIEANIEKDGHLWVAKTRLDLEHETGLSQQKIKRSLEFLKRNNFIIIKIYKLDGLTVSHFRVNLEKILEELKKISDDLP